MKLQIVRIADRGVPGQERLHLSVSQDCNLCYYVALISKVDGAGVTNGSLSAFWFPNQLAKTGDQLILYSRAGVTSSQAAGLTTNHFFFWGLPKAVWSDPASTAVVVEANTWLSAVV